MTQVGTSGTAPVEGLRAGTRPAGVHVPALDGVRGIAILLVLVFHFMTPTNPVGAAEHGLAWLLSYGALGVNLFFILSGFLITGILYDSSSEPAYFRNFYMRRVLRIFPLYYAVLVVVFFVVPAVPAFQGSEIAGLREHQAWAWLYAVNIYIALHGGWVLSYIEHFWSLAVEEHFYFVWPFAVWFLAANRRALMAFALIVALASFAGRLVAAQCDVNPIVMTVLTPFQLDALALGGFLAIYLRRPDGADVARRAVAPLVISGFVILLLQFGIRHWLSHDGILLALRSGAFHLMFAGLLLRAVSAGSSDWWGRVLCSAPMAWLGKYSYGLYVYHHFASYYLTTHGTDLALASIVGSRIVALVILTAGGLAASALVAWLSYEFFEKPFLKLKRHWTPQSRAADLQA